MPDWGKVTLESTSCFCLHLKSWFTRASRLPPSTHVPPLSASAPEKRRPFAEGARDSSRTDLEGIAPLLPSRGLPLPLSLLPGISISIVGSAASPGVCDKGALQPVCVLRVSCEPRATSQVLSAVPSPRVSPAWLTPDSIQMATTFDRERCRGLRRIPDSVSPPLVSPVHTTAARPH